MSIRTWLLFLVGNRQATLALAADRRALWVGLLFVLSAGFAREYDGEDLLHEPWHVLIPLAASLFASLVLFSVLYLKLIWSDVNRPRFVTAYRSFLTLFWMTAPLAWLYAIPYERFLPPLDALRANLLTLGLVASWRVVLMIRVASVLLNYRGWAALGLVMLYGDLVALLAMTFMPIDIIPTMGGMRGVTVRDEILLSVKGGVACTGCGLLPVWLILAIVALIKDKPIWWGLTPEQARSTPSSGRVLLALGVVSVVVWALVLPWTQPAQQLRHQVEQELASGRIAEALDLMSTHSPTDFPPHWEPPSRIGAEGRNPLGIPPLGANYPHPLDVLAVVADRPVAPWVRQVYLTKLESFLKVFHFPYSYYPLAREQVETLVKITLEWPEGPDLANQHESAIAMAINAGDYSKEESESLKWRVKEVKEKKP